MSRFLFLACFFISSFSFSQPEIELDVAPHMIYSWKGGAVSEKSRSFKRLNTIAFHDKDGNEKWRTELTAYNMDTEMLVDEKSDFVFFVHKTKSTKVPFSVRTIDQLGNTEDSGEKLAGIYEQMKLKKGVGAKLDFAFLHKNNLYLLLRTFIFESENSWNNWILKIDSNFNYELNNLSIVTDRESRMKFVDCIDNTAYLTKTNSAQGGINLDLVKINLTNLANEKLFENLTLKFSEVPNIKSFFVRNPQKLITELMIHMNFQFKTNVVFYENIHVDGMGNSYYGIKYLYDSKIIGDNIYFFGPAKKMEEDIDIGMWYCQASINESAESVEIESKLVEAVNGKRVIRSIGLYLDENNQVNSVISTKEKAFLVIGENKKEISKTNMKYYTLGTPFRSSWAVKNFSRIYGYEPPISIILGDGSHAFIQKLGDNKFKIIRNE